MRAFMHACMHARECERACVRASERRMLRNLIAELHPGADCDNALGRVQQGTPDVGGDGL